MERAANRSERLLQLEAVLLAHPEGLRRAELARRLGVHRSTIGRDVVELGRRVPIWEDDDGLMGINREGYLVDVRLTLNEAMALHLAARLLATRMDRHNPHAAAGLRKLGLALERMAPLVSQHLQLSAAVMDGPGQRRDPTYLNVLEALTKGWALGRKVHLTHQSRTGRDFDYTFAPYFIEPYAVGRTAHVIGRCDRPAGLRTFKLERIRAARLLEEPYRIPKDFDASQQLEAAWGIWYTDREPVEVVLRFNPRVAGRVRETQWHRSEQLEEEPNGTLLWRAWVAEPREMTPWIRGFGSDVVALAPRWLREELRGEARRLARIYGWHVYADDTARPGQVDDDQRFRDIFGS